MLESRFPPSLDKNSAESGVSPVYAFLQNRAKCKNSTKVYTATAANTEKAVHLSPLCWVRQKLQLVGCT